jgi:hypothetical protein
VRDLTQRSLGTQVASGHPYSKARFRRNESVTEGNQWKLNFHLYIQFVNLEDNSVVKCTVCISNVSIASGGRTSI